MKNNVAFEPSPAYVQTYTATPTGRSSATLVATGCNTVITPQVTGRVLVLCSGSIGNGTTTDGFTYNLYYGTGAAPANNDAVSGTAIATLQTITSVVTSCLKLPFALHGIVTGLAVTAPNAQRQTVAGTPYWFDVMFSYVTGGTVTLTGVSLTLIEF